MNVQPGNDKEAVNRSLSDNIAVYNPRGVTLYSIAMGDPFLLCDAFVK